MDKDKRLFWPDKCLGIMRKSVQQGVAMKHLFAAVATLVLACSATAAGLDDYKDLKLPEGTRAEAGKGAVSVMYLGVPLSKFALMVMVLVAALPSASNVAMLAEKFDADSGRIARIILVTTAAAFLTFSGAVGLLKG